MKRTPVLALLVITLLAVLPLAVGNVAAAGTSVSGTVFDIDDDPFADADVIIFTKDGGGQYTVEHARVKSGENGRYSLQLADGEYRITAEAEGYRLASYTGGEFTVSSQPTIELDDILVPLVLIEAHCTVTGTISGEDGPVSDAVIRIMHGEEEFGRAQSDANGGYSFAGENRVRSGTHTLIVEKDGFVTHEEEIIAPSEGSIVVDVDLVALSSHSLTGEIFSTSGPLKDCEVTLTRVTTLMGDPVTYVAFTVADGRFHFPKVLDGSYTMEIERDGYTVFQNIYAEFEIDADLVFEHKIVMTEAYGHIHGLVYDGDFKISNARLILLDQSGKELQRATSDNEGRYRFNDVPTGTYLLKVVRNGYEDAESSITVLASGTVDLNFPLVSIDRSYLFGLDLPHSLMVVGIGLAVLFLLLTVGFRTKVDENEGLIYLKALEEDEEEA